MSADHLAGRFARDAEPFRDLVVGHPHTPSVL
jgi:hypothetical protein